MCQAIIPTRQRTTQRFNACKGWDVRTIRGGWTKWHVGRASECKVGARVNGNRVEANCLFCDVICLADKVNDVEDSFDGCLVSSICEWTVSLKGLEERTLCASGVAT